MQHKPYAMLTMEVYENRRKGSVGSSRIRGDWVTKHATNIENYQIGVHYEAMIYQKVYWVEHAMNFSGAKIFDLCDPDWLNGRQVMRMLELCDAVTVPTEPLAEYLRKVQDKPVFVIPDRVDLAGFPTFKQEHTGDLKTVVWYGYADNQSVLDQVVIPLQNAGCQLVVISDRPYHDADVNITYNAETIADDLMQFDAVLNVQSAKNIKYQFKSNNKTTFAWALGMPVIESPDDLVRFKSAEARKEAGLKGRQDVIQLYDVKLSAMEMENVIMKVLQTKQGGQNGQK